jgi:uncharacterized membrane protein (UPF0127 family)
MLAAMRRSAPILLALTLAACGGGGNDGRARAVITTAAGDVTVDVEVADDQTERARGLMGRNELAPDAGMIFVFPEDTRGAFWMKDTLIPLSIAFYGEDGEILRILDMEPCRGEDCPLYDPGVAYRGALEVNQGAFERWNVEEGDRIRLEE